ncbi:MAG: helix-turn-helix domain containing protein [Bacteroides sp.]|nr:helix-turn-helix domain containing protein [Bacteroides sp.]
MYRKHSFEEKLNLVSQVKSGISLKLVARKYDLEPKLLRHWVGLYDKYGESGLEKRFHIRVTTQVKEQIAGQIVENSISLPQDACSTP